MYVLIAQSNRLHAANKEIIFFLKKNVVHGMM